MKNQNILYEKAYAFAIRTVKLSQYLNNETKYWINLLHDTQYITQQMFESLLYDIKELIGLPVSITKSIKQNP